MGNKLCGNYNDQFGESIALKPDSTFVHSYKYDLVLRWTNGKWKVENGKYQIPPYSMIKTNFIR